MLEMTTKMMMVAAVVLACAVCADSCTLCGLPCPKECYQELVANGCPEINSGSNKKAPAACQAMVQDVKDSGNSQLKNVFAKVVNAACADDVTPLCDGTDDNCHGKLAVALLASTDRDECESPSLVFFSLARSLSSLRLHARDGHRYRRSGI